MSALGGLDRRRLGLGLGLFCLALALPSGLLVYQAFSQLKWEAFHRQRTQAEDLATRIDRQLGRLIALEEARPFADYSFLTVAGDPAANFLQRSPLAAFPVPAGLPGLVGYFLVDARGELTTPLLPRLAEPAALGIAPEELAQRRALEARIQTILSENRLVEPQRERQQLKAEAAAPPPGPTPSARDHLAEEAEVAVPTPVPTMAQAAFDQLGLARRAQAPERKDTQQADGGLGRVEDLPLDVRLRNQPAAAPPLRTAPKGEMVQSQERRKERSALPEPAPQVPGAGAAGTTPTAGLRIHTFESELDPFAMARLDSGHFVLYRKVWRAGQRQIQGALIEPRGFLRGALEIPFREDAMAQTSQLVVAYRGDVLAAIAGQAERGYLSRAEELRGSLLYQTRLSAPLGDLELIFSVTQLPMGPGGALLGWLGALLLGVLCGGGYALYRLGLRQIKLARQQQDFVSAVSHELKTPLTSIRLFSEILRQGWASEEKKRAYYDYIFAESERLSRLIANVLQLARLTRNEQALSLKPLTLADLLEEVRPKLDSQCEQAGFRLTLTWDEAAGAIPLRADPDAFAQILINLVDNAIKFSAKAPTRAVDIHCQRQRDGGPRVSVRDYGPGVPRDQMKRIFKLFYRAENELTRETLGTGIGLALARQLAQAMGARLDVLNREPGAEFTLSFPRMAALAIGETKAPD